MDFYTIVFMIVLLSLINVLSWLIIGYVIGTYVSKHARCSMLCAQVAGVFGSLAGGLLAFFAYGFSDTILWANSLLFSFVGALGFIYIALPEEERAAKVENIFRRIKKLNQFYIDLAGFKR